mmetsp:Transcript_68103/g.197368  ORF Transcript_68103/g.197368 Transcript_68103/m.197368 type:complete len:507 (+) Transcript_68103:67-1587(+)
MGDEENPLEAVANAIGNPMDAIGDAIGNPLDAVGSALGGVGDAIKDEFVGTPDVAENQEVTEESGCSRLCGSILCCLVAAPLLIIGGAFCAGFNEKNYLCNDRAINEGFDVVVEVTSCGDAGAGSGSLVHFSCDLDLDESSKEFKPWPKEDDVYTGFGLKTEVEVYQCVENKRSTSETKAGGKKQTVTTYTYEKAWRSSYIDSSKFKKKDTDEWRKGCGMENPPWPDDLPAGGTSRADSAKIGAYVVSGSYLTAIELKTRITDIPAPSGWVIDDDRYYRSAAGASMTPTATSAPAAAMANTTVAPSTIPSASASSATPQVGDARVAFYSNDPNALTYTVLGENKAGAIGKWTASDSWGCSGFTLGSMRKGTVSAKDFQDSLEAGNTFVLYFLRILAFALIWFGLSRCAGPCEVVAECVPFIGGYLGDAVECIACAVTCCPALACCFGVASIVYVAMRPMLGIPMMLFFLITAGAFAFWKFKKEKKKAQGSNDPGSDVSTVRPKDTE